MSAISLCVATHYAPARMVAFTHRSIPPAPYNEVVAIAFAEDWRSGVFTPLGADASSLGAMDCEDPHLYRTERGCHFGKGGRPGRQGSGAYFLD